MAVLTPPRAATPIDTSKGTLLLTTNTRRKVTDRVAACAIGGAFALAMVPLMLITWQVVDKGAAAMGTEFFTYSMRNIVGAGGGIYHALVGTLLISGAATVISVPVGMLTAIYLVEYGADTVLARTITLLVDVMTGIPSIIAGLFAYALFTMIFGPGVRMGIGGAVALSVLMTPVVVRTSEEMLNIVPHELRESAYALGVPRWRTIVKVVVPTASGGLLAGVVLAIARIIGETAPLLLIAGTTASSNWNLFDGRMQTLPVFAFSQQNSPGMFPEAALERAWGAALVLMIIVMALNLIARAIAAIFAPKGDH